MRLPVAEAVLFLSDNSRIIVKSYKQREKLPDEERKGTERLFYKCSDNRQFRDKETNDTKRRTLTVIFRTYIIFAWRRSIW